MSALTKEQIDALPGLVADVPKQWRFSETVSDDGQEWFGCGVMIDGYEAVWLDNEAEKDTPTCRLIALAPYLAATVIEQQAEIERLLDAAWSAGRDAAAEAAGSYDPVAAMVGYELEPPSDLRAVLEVKP